MPCILDHYIPHPRELDILLHINAMSYSQREQEPKTNQVGSNPIKFLVY